MHLAFLLLAGAVILLALAKGTGSYHGPLALAFAIAALLIYLLKLRIIM